MLYTSIFLNKNTVSDICIFQIKMELQAKNDGQMMTQGVVLQYRDKYIKINTEAQMRTHVQT